MANWKKDFDPKIFSEEIEDARIVRNDGKVVFQGFAVSVYKTFIFSMVKFSDEIPEAEGRRIVSNAIFKTGKRKITPDSLISEISMGEQDYLAKSPKRFVLATSVSIRKNIKLDKKYWGRNQIIFERHYPRSFTNASLELRNQAKKSLFVEPPKDYLAVRVHLSAISESEAAEKALDQLDLYRGIWNLLENRRHSTRISYGGSNTPVNRIILGPIHSLHYPQGAIASENRYWYERTYVAPISPFLLKINKQFLKNETTLLTWIDKCPYRDAIKGAIIRYSRALDDRNLDTAFIRLWGVLELLTDTVKLPQEQTIKRAAALFEDYDLMLQTLKHLMNYRNRSVHAGTESSDLEIYLYELKNIVEDLILFHLRNNAGFQALAQAGVFLSLPRSEESLKTKYRFIEYALKFRGYTNK